MIFRSCIFDEWAADQDPVFKSIFYEELVPQLKREGKIVIVITHDDSYFHLADQMIKIADGSPINVPIQSLSGLEQTLH